VKIFAAGVAVAMLMVSPLHAQLQTSEGPSHSRAYPEQKGQLRATYLGPDGSAWNSGHPRSNADSNEDPMRQRLCSTAPGFCPDYHGGNGG
jgi:hypothetical protein